MFVYKNYYQIKVRTNNEQEQLIVFKQKKQIMQNNYPFNMQEHIFDFKVKVNFQNGNVSLTAPQIVTPPAYFQNNNHNPLINNSIYSNTPSINNTFVPHNPYSGHIQSPILMSANRNYIPNNSYQNQNIQTQNGNTSFNSFRSSQFEINQSLEMIECVLCQRTFNTNQFDLHLQMHKNRPTYSKQNQSNNGKTQNSVNQNSFNSFHNKNQYSFQDNNSIGSNKHKQLAHFTPNINVNHSISSQQNYMTTRPVIQPHINGSFQSLPGSSRDHPQVNVSKGLNQNSMHYSSSSNQSQYNNREQILPHNLTNSFKQNSSGSVNNPNFIVVQQMSNNPLGPSFFQQSSRQNHQSSRQNNPSKESSRNYNLNKSNSISHQIYQNGLNNFNNANLNNNDPRMMNMKSIQSKYVKQNVSNSRNMNPHLYNSMQDNNRFHIFQDQGLSSISGQSRISQHSFSSQLSQFKSSANKSANYQSADASLRKQMTYQNQNQEKMEKNSHKSQGNFFKKKSNQQHLTNTVNSFNSKFKNQESSSDDEQYVNGKLSFNERLKQKQLADRQVQSVQLCQCKSVQLKSKMSNSKNSKFSDQTFSKTKLPVNYLARQDFISTSSKSTHKE